MHRLFYRIRSRQSTAAAVRRLPAEKNPQTGTGVGSIASKEKEAKTPKRSAGNGYLHNPGTKHTGTPAGTIVRPDGGEDETLKGASA
jgi:hypothetical protein